MLIYIDRKQFLFINNKNARTEFVRKIISKEFVDELDSSEIDEVTFGVVDVITKNEALIKKVGFKSYFNNDYPAKIHVHGSFYRTGKVIVYPFDWSVVDNNNNFDYSFVLSRII